MPRSERRPDALHAAAELVAAARRRFPFEHSTAALCAGPCTGCPKKLLELAEVILTEWEEKLAQQHQPSLGDVQRLARQLNKLAQAFSRNQLLAAPGWGASSPTPAAP